MGVMLFRYALMKETLNLMNDCRITVDNDKVFQMERDGDTLLVNGEAVFPDMVQVGEGGFHVLLNNRSFNVEVVGLEAKSGKIKVNGHLKSISSRDQGGEGRRGGEKDVGRCR